MLKYHCNLFLLTSLATFSSSCLHVVLQKLKLEQNYERRRDTYIGNKIECGGENGQYKTRVSQFWSIAGPSPTLSFLITNDRT